jgi:hypothetical protein
MIGSCSLFQCAFTSPGLSSVFHFKAENLIEHSDWIPCSVLWSACPMIWSLCRFHGLTWQNPIRTGNCVKAFELCIMRYKLRSRFSHLDAYRCNTLNAYNKHQIEKENLCCCYCRPDIFQHLKINFRGIFFYLFAP